MKTAAKTWGTVLGWLAAVPAALGATAVPGPSVSPGPDIRAIVPPQPYFLKGSVLWLVVAAASLLLAGLVAWYLLRRPRAPRPTGPRINPRDLARQRLAELAARADALDARTFGGEACDILRMYVADEYRLQPQRQTSPEFLATVAASRVFSRREHALLGGFLEGCDGLKFARLDATSAGKRALLEQAGEFLDGQPPEPAAPPPPPPAGVPVPTLPFSPPLPPEPAAAGDDRRWQPPAAVPPPLPPP